MSMNEQSPERFPIESAERLLARAAALDAQDGAGTVHVADLRRAALDAGIGEAAFETALREAASPLKSNAPKPPWIVRVTLIGVPNRVVAWGFYAVFSLALLSTGVAAVAAKAGATVPLAQDTPLLLFVAFWSFFSLWSTAKAIRWADTHGWDKLP